MSREISPGLKILWIWTIGTAAIMVTNVVRTRLRDMEQPTNNDQQQSTFTATATDSILVDPTPESDEGFVKEVKA
ncbi:hypothetical protein EZV62_019689 [Acer yangbiense]|uniref:Uncharacterized protein n=1 Tax=Acer yangbiense TaxID=1000413 RepID=A0A5C7HBF5_9ROSI|nr:hypothetical protein EZV62_019689 [Acer yangbiense]